VTSVGGKKQPEQHDFQFTVSASGKVQGAIVRQGDPDGKLQEAFRNVVEKQISLKGKHLHNIVVDKTREEGVYKLCIDNKNTFFVNVKDVGAPIVVQQLVEKRTFLTKIDSFVRSIGALFYRPFVDEKSVGKSAHAASRDEYKNLLQSLKKGSRWLEAESDETKLKPQKVSKAKEQVQSAIESAEKIHKALSCPPEKRQQALQTLALNLSSEITVNLYRDKETIVPVGYMQDGKLEPLFLRFYKVSDTEYRVELYSDLIEGSIATYSSTVENLLERHGHIEQLLNEFFTPFIHPHAKSLSVAEMTRGARSFGEALPQVVEDESQKALMERAMGRDEHAPAASDTLTLGQLVRFPERHGFKTIATQDASAVDKEVKSRTRSPDAVVAWLDHLQPGLSQSEKLDLLQRLTLDWVDASLKQLPKHSLDEQIQILQECQDQLTCVDEQLITHLTGGDVRRREVVSLPLRKKSLQVKEKLDKLQAKQRQSLVTLQQEVLQKAQKTTLSIAVPSVSVSQPTPQPQTVPPVATSTAPSMPADLEKLQKSLEAIQLALSPASQQEKAKESALQALQERLSPGDYANLQKLLEEKKYEAFIQQAAVHLVPDEKNRSYFVQQLLYPLLSHECSTDLLVDSNLTLLAAREDFKGTAGFGFNEYNQAKNLRVFLDLAKCIPADSSIDLQIAYLRKIGGSPDQIETATALRDTLPSQPSDKLQPLDPTDVVKKIVSCQEEIQKIRNSALQEPNLEKRMELLALARQKSFDLLALFPPANAGAKPDSVRFYSILTLDELESMQKTVAALEETIWEASMKLQLETLSPREELMLFKAQSIHGKIMTEKGFRAYTLLLEQIKKAPPSDVQGVPGIIEDFKTKELRINWKALDEASVKKLVELYNRAPGPKPEFQDLFSASRSFATSDLDAFLYGKMNGDFGFSPQEREELTCLNQYQQSEKRAPVLGQQADSEHGFFTSHNKIHTLYALAQGVDPLRVRYPQDVQRLYKSQLYMQLQKRPHTTIQAESALDSSLPFFVSHNNSLLKLGALDIPFPFPQAERKPLVMTSGGKEIAHIHLLGHQNLQHLSEREGAQTVLCEQPSNISGFDSVEKEFRFCQGLSLDQMLQQIVDEARERQLDIPTDVMQTLLAIRQMDEQTILRQETVINALQFLVNIENQPFLEFDSVQRFFEEIFLNHFLVVSALLSNAQLLPEYLERLNKAIDYSMKQTLRPKTAAFLTNLQYSLAEAIDYTVNEIEQHGLNSPYFWSMMPCSRKANGGYSQVALNTRAIQDDMKKNLAEKRVEPGVLRSDYATQPILDTIGYLLLASETLRSKTKESADDLVALITTKLQSPILQDSERKELMIELVFYYSKQKEPLKNEQFVQILQAITLLSQESVPTEKAQLVTHLIEWYQAECLPKITPEILQMFLQLQLANRYKKDTIKGAAWVKDPAIPHMYYLQKGENRLLSVNLRDASITGSDLYPLESKKTQETIPEALLERPPLSQALHAKTIVASVERIGFHTKVYTWSHEGQDFSLTVSKGQVALTRKVDTIEYTFTAMKLTPSNSAEALISEHGLWQKSQDASMHLFTSGMNRPRDSEHYSIQVSADKTKIQGLQSGGLVVVASKALLEQEPLPFVASKDAVFLADPKTKKVCEVRVSKLNLTLKKDDTGTWLVDRGVGKKEVYSVSEGEKEEKARFGDSWQQFVIPVQVTEGDQVQRNYLILPYECSRMPGGGIRSRGDVEGVYMPIELSIDASGRMTAPPEGFLYLAYQMIAQADASRSPEEAQKKHLLAQEYLELALKANPLNKAKKGVQTHEIAVLIHKMVEHLRGDIPKETTRIMELKLELTLYRLQEKANLSRTEPMGPQEAIDHLRSMSRIATLYDQCKTPKEALCKERLEPDEVAAIDEINKALLKELCRDFSKEPNKAAPPAANIVIDMPTTLSPELLVALFRAAKPPESLEKKQLTELVGPLFASELMQNFWVYAQAIHTHKIPPSELRFLFQPCDIGRVSSATEAQEARRLELEARKFLLALSALEVKISDPFTQAAKEFQELQKNVGSDLSDKALDDLVVFGQDIKDHAGAVRNTVLQIDLSQISGKEVPEKMRIFEESLHRIRQPLDAFYEVSSKKLQNATKILADLQKEKDRLDKEQAALQASIASIENQMQGASDDEEKILQAQLETKQAELDAHIQTIDKFNSQKVDNFFSVNLEQSSVEELLAFSSIEEGQRWLQGLSELVAQTKKTKDMLDGKITELTEYKEFMKEAEPFFDACKKLFDPNTKVVQPVGTMELPRQEVLSALIKIAQAKEKDEALSPVQVLQTLGLSGTLYALQNQKKLGALTEMAPQYLPFLIGLTQIRSVVGDSVSVEARKAFSSAMQLDGEKDTQTLEKVLSFLSPEEREVAMKNLSQMQPSEKSDYVNQLAKVLSRRADFVATTLQVNKNVQEVNMKLQNGVGACVKKHAASKALAASKNTLLQGHYGNRYAPFFTHRSDTPSNEEKQILASHLAKSGHFGVKNFFTKPAGTETIRDPTIRYYKEALDEVLAEQGKISAEYEAAIGGVTSFSVDDVMTLLDVLDKTRKMVTVKKAIAEHEKIISDMRGSLPSDKDSQYYKDLQRGIDTLAKEPPVERKPVVSSKNLDRVEKQIHADIQEVDQGEQKMRARAFIELQKIPFSALPKELQRNRQKGGSNQEFVEIALKLYRKGTFHEYPAADAALSDCATLGVKKKMLMRSLDTVSKLHALQEKKKSLTHPTKEELDTIEKEWASLSDKLLEALDRCQDLQGVRKKIDTLEHLKPHVRKLEYMMYRRGLVLRDKQLETLNEVLGELKAHPDNPSLLKELRMGAGKTDVLLPILLDCMPELGYNPIGMVPKALLTQNFSEMDENTRILFELSGNLFEFSRRDAVEPLTDSTLLRLTDKCLNLVRAAENGEYVLTTIEAKASLDDKIEEIERSTHSLQHQYKQAKERLSQAQADNDTDEIQRAKKEVAALVAKLVTYEQCLDVLYATKAIFSDKKSILIIDEADSVAKANFSVNAEMGKKEPPAHVLQNVSYEIFSRLANSENDTVKELRQAIFQNEQFTITDKKQVDAYLKAIALEWIGRQAPQDIPQEVLAEWMSGKEMPHEHKGKPLPLEYAAMRKTLNSSLRASLELKIGLTCALDSKKGAMGVPATQGLVSPDTKYADPLMQLCLTYMLSLHAPLSNDFIHSIAQDIADELALLPGGDAQAAHTLLKSLITQSKSNPDFDWKKALSGQEEAKVYLRLKMAQYVGKNNSIYLSQAQVTQPVQRAIAGCNVVGLTGTATRNLEHIISNMKSVNESGRLVTAEVLYRVAKASSQGLDTQVVSYSQDSGRVLNDFIAIATEKKADGKHQYHAIMNQAGACDAIAIQTIIETIAEKSGRPVITVAPCTLNEGTKDEIKAGAKCYCLNGQFTPYTPKVLEEFKKQNLEPFYFYDAARCRGTHFDIPLGITGVAFLSPTVNASDRDQTEYRLRQIGEGHNLQIRIAEKQYAEIHRQTGKTPTVRDVFKVNHDKTTADEKKENLAALKLAIRGVLDREAKEIKGAFYRDAGGKKVVRSEGEYLSAEKREELDEELQDKAELSELFALRFSEDTSNAKYLKDLESEFSAQSEQETKAYTLQMIDKELAIVTRMRKRSDEKLQSAKSQASKDRWALAVEHLDAATTKLIEKRAKIEKNFETEFAPNLPPTVAASLDAAQAAETEAEAEAEAEAVAEAVAETETLDNARRAYDKKRILDTVSAENLPSPSNTYEANLAPKTFLRQAQDSSSKFRLWQPQVQATPFLRQVLGSYTGTRLPPIAVVVTEAKKPVSGTVVTAMTTSELSGKGMRYLNHDTERSYAMYSSEQDNEFLCRGCFVAIMDAQGGVDFVCHQRANGMSDYTNTLNADAKLKGKLLLLYLTLGHMKFSKQNWAEMQEAYTAMSAEEKESFKAHATKEISAKNKDFLPQVQAQIFDYKPPRTGFLALLEKGNKDFTDRQWERAQKEYRDMQSQEQQTFKAEVEKMIGGDEKLFNKVKEKIFGDTLLQQ